MNPNGKAANVIVLDAPFSRIWSAAFALASFAILPIWAASTASPIGGWVVDATGKPVNKARVYISVVSPQDALPPTGTVITGPLVTAVDADSRGAFTAAGLPDGRYIACAEAPNLLDPCIWSATAPTFAVNAGGADSPVTIILSRGAQLPIHIDDPHGFLKNITTPVDFDLQVHVVTSNGLHDAVPIQAQGASGRDHAITIPFDTDLTVYVISAILNVNDAFGNSVSASGAQVRTPAGTNPNLLRYTVTSRKQPPSAVVPGGIKIP